MSSADVTHDTVLLLFMAPLIAVHALAALLLAGVVVARTPIPPELAVCGLRTRGSLAAVAVGLLGYAQVLALVLLAEWR